MATWVISRNWVGPECPSSTNTDAVASRNNAVLLMQVIVIKSLINRNGDRKADR
jgi:hypothetical protein